IKQARSEFILQFPNLLRQRGLRYVLTLCGPSEASLFSNRAEISELVDFHGSFSVTKYKASFRLTRKVGVKGANYQSNRNYILDLYLTPRLGLPSEDKQCQRSKSSNMETCRNASAWK